MTINNFAKICCCRNSFNHSLHHSPTSPFTNTPQTNAANESRWITILLNHWIPNLWLCFWLFHADMPIDRILFYFCISKLYASELNKLLIYLINLYFHLQIRTNLRISIFLHFWRGQWDFFKFKLKKRFLRYFQLNNFLDIFLSIWCNFIYPK